MAVSSAQNNRKQNDVFLMILRPEISGAKHSIYLALDMSEHRQGQYSYHDAHLSGCGQFT